MQLASGYRATQGEEEEEIRSRGDKGTSTNWWGGTQLRYAGAILKGRIVLILSLELGISGRVDDGKRDGCGCELDLAVARLDLGHAIFGQRV